MKTGRGREISPHWCQHRSGRVYFSPWTDQGRVVASFAFCWKIQRKRKLFFLATKRNRQTMISFLFRENKRQNKISLFLKKSDMMRQNSNVSPCGKTGRKGERCPPCEHREIVDEMSSLLNFNKGFNNVTISLFLANRTETTFFSYVTKARGSVYVSVRVHLCV